MFARLCSVYLRIHDIWRPRLVLKWTSAATRKSLVLLKKLSTSKKGKIPSHLDIYEIYLTIKFSQLTESFVVCCDHWPKSRQPTPKFNSWQKLLKCISLFFPPTSGRSSSAKFLVSRSFLSLLAENVENKVAVALEWEKEQRNSRKTCHNHRGQHNDEQSMLGIRRGEEAEPQQTWPWAGLL